MTELKVCIENIGNGYLVSGDYIDETMLFCKTIEEAQQKATKAVNEWNKEFEED